MKPKSFTYNQIIVFFQENKLPLTREQIILIASKVKEELVLLEEHKAKKKYQADQRFLKREKRKNDTKRI
jgi:hypothetical protein